MTLPDPLERAVQRYRQVSRMGLRLKGWAAYANAAASYLELLAGTSRRRARPMKLIFDPTNACQLECPLCPTGTGQLDRRPGQAELDLFRRLMEQWGEYLFFVDFYNWGEPLLNPRLDEFLAIAHEHRVSSVVSTNLSMRLSDERIQRLLASGVSEIGVAADGATAETYATYRRGGRFDLVMANMRRLVEVRERLGQRHPLISWYFIVFAFNEHEIDLARRMARDIGVDRIVFRPPFLDEARYEIPDEDRRAIVRWVPRQRRFHAHVGPPTRASRCGWHYTAAAVNFDGTVTPCSTAFRKEDDFGSFGRRGEEDAQSVINNEAFRAARDHLAGRSPPASGIICERCPTPSIRSYHRQVYRQLAIITAVQLLEAAANAASVIRGSAGSSQRPLRRRPADGSSGPG